MTKQEAIKKIEKLTRLKQSHYCKFIFMKEYYEPMYNLCVGKDVLMLCKKYDDDCNWLGTYEWKYWNTYKKRYGQTTYMEIPLEWLEPLSKLIPILFEKEGE